MTLIITSILRTALWADAVPAESRPSQKECVALLHGLGRTHASMSNIADALDTAGYQTINIGYPSRKYPIEQLAFQVIPRIIQQCTKNQCTQLHFVTHSMGGIILRYYLSRHTIDFLGRVVMIGPPNQGSEIADAMRKSRLFRWYNGPAGQQLCTGANGITSTLGPVDYPVGIIAGNVHSFFDVHWSRIIPGPDDGKVSVESAKVEGMSDFLVVPYAHTFIMNQKEVMAQTIQFLRHGHFANQQ